MDDHFVALMDEDYIKSLAQLLAQPNGDDGTVKGDGSTAAAKAT